MPAELLHHGENITDFPAEKEGICRTCYLEGCMTCRPVVMAMASASGISFSVWAAPQESEKISVFFFLVKTDNQPQMASARLGQTQRFRNNAKLHGPKHGDARHDIGPDGIEPPVHLGR